MNQAAVQESGCELLRIARLWAAVVIGGVGDIICRMIGGCSRKSP
jgi:ABC-type branched-subunit amino acid transport system permease subunit